MGSVVKKRYFASDVLFEWPLKQLLRSAQSLIYKQGRIQENILLEDFCLFFLIDIKKLLLEEPRVTTSKWVTFAIISSQLLGLLHLLLIN